MNQRNSMRLKIKHIPVRDGAAIVSCAGSGSAVCLPETVNGLLVREICPYAFSSEEDAVGHLPGGVQIRSAWSGGSAALGDGTAFLGGPSLREVILPAGVRSIGEYAFYNCTGLSRIDLCGGEARVGNGAFMNCGALSELCFSASADERTCLPGLLAEISREVRVSFDSADATSVWIFPEYFEESVENAPARIFERFIHGAGYRYRQCFDRDVLDPEAYDGQFPMAQVEAAPKTVLTLALERLRHPFRLSETAEKRYLAYLGENAAAAAELLIAKDDPDGLAFLAAQNVLTRESVGMALASASRAGRAECLGVLLNIQHSRFRPEEKQFEL